MEEIAEKVRKHLETLNLETPMTDYRDTYKESVDSMHALLKGFGLDTTNNSIQDTPKRVVDMYRDELFIGLDYSNFPNISMFDLGEKAKGNIVVERNIQIHSVCEHHLIPFIGCAHIAYIPNKRVIGLSKLNRVADFFSRRPQVQERLTEQIKEALVCILETTDVAVIVDTEHMCVKLRGVKDQNSSTITSAMGGRFMDNGVLRAELLTLIGMKRG